MAHRLLNPHNDTTYPTDRSDRGVARPTPRHPRVPNADARRHKHMLSKHGAARSPLVRIVLGFARIRIRSVASASCGGGDAQVTLLDGGAAVRAAFLAFGFARARPFTSAKAEAGGDAAACGGAEGMATTAVVVGPLVSSPSSC